MPKPQSPTLNRLLNDERFYIEKLIRIEDKNQNKIDFVYNAAQELMASSLTGRDLVIKGRQLGSTTYFLARALRKCMTTPGTTAVIVCYEEFLTQRLLHRVQVMYDSIPAKLKPKMHHSSSFEKSFPSINSVIYIGTAGAKVFGRGEPIHFFLGSEVAFWDSAWKTLTPILQAVPLGSGEVVLESTANGMGDPEHPDQSKHNAFFDLVTETLDSPNSIWKLHQLVWWLAPDYRLPLGSMSALPNDRGHLTYSNEEVDLIKRAGWNDEEAEERIRFRRLKIQEIKHMFWQEYLEDMSSCFLVAGDTYYDADELERLLASVYDAPYSFNSAKVWHEPVDRSEYPVYSIAVDPGQGKNTRSVATVWRHDLNSYTRTQHCATLSGFYDSMAFAPMVMELGEYYHTARIVSEANGHGASFCSEVKEYPNLYYRTDVISGISTKQIGWMTTGTPNINGNGTKPYMMNELNQLLPSLECHDFEILRDIQQVRRMGNRVSFLTSADYHDSAAIMAGTRQGIAAAIVRGYVGNSGWKV